MSEYLFLLCLMEEVSKYIVSIRIGFQSFFMWGAIADSIQGYLPLLKEVDLTSM